MEKLTLSDSDKLLKQLETSVSLIQDPVLLQWSAGYLKKHKGRYHNDLEVLSIHYNTGEILELGALPGHMTFMLNRVGLPVTSFDLNPTRAQEYVKKNGLSIMACDIEQERLPLQDSSFSIVLLNEVFEHLRVNPLFTLREINRVLQTEGKLIITTPNLYSLRNRLQFALGKGLGDPVKAFQKLETMGHMGHLREYSRREMIRFIHASGFQLIDHHYTSYQIPKMLIRPVYWLFPGLRPFQVLVISK